MGEDELLAHGMMAYRGSVHESGDTEGQWNCFFKQGMAMRIVGNILDDTGHMLETTAGPLRTRVGDTGCGRRSSREMKMKPELKSKQSEGKETLHKMSEKRGEDDGCDQPAREGCIA